MQFSDILGQEHIKNHLIKSASLKRIPHAQLFIGPEGSGTLPMAIAYAEHLLCSLYADGSKEKESCSLKFKNLSHPDLHFVYPVATNDTVKSKPVSQNFIADWREFIAKNPYGNLFDWYKKIGVEKKQGQIGVEEASEINRTLSLKSYEGGYKIMIIWMADKLNSAASNKLLKLLEEPPAKTIFILITEHLDDILQTIVSRCQLIDFIGLAEETIANALVSRENCDEKTAQKIAHQSEGNYNKALHLLKNDDDYYPFEKWFIDWVRTAFKAKGNAAAIHDLIIWSETLAGVGREVQKQFLNYCIHFFRQALLSNYQVDTLVYYEPKDVPFDLKKFAPFVEGSNILDIFKELEDAIYHIERNGNSKIIFTDLSIKLTRLIHKK